MSTWEKHLIWWSTAAVALTGFVYAWMKYLLQPADEWAIVNHPLQPLILKLHILVAPVLVFAIGLITSRHILAHLRSRTPSGRRSGTSAALIIVPMILSGYLMQAVTHSGLLSALGYLHLAVGTVYAAAFLAHALATRRLRRARGSDRRAAADPLQGASRPLPTALRSRRSRRIRS
jgi:hypothetical protein